MAKTKLNLLCAKGYLPKELPPTFMSKDLGMHALDVIKDWATTSVIPSDYNSAEKRRKKLIDTEPESYSCPKGLHDRRVMHITHPVTQTLLAYIISKNWSTISSWLGRAKFSFDKTVIVESARRAIPEPAFLKHLVHKELIESSATWIVKSDITRFYPSVYTHSIPWAAYGKEKVKKNISFYTDKLGDQLDVLVRKSNRNQTVGIPIGPDTSRIIADIISSYVDCEIDKKIKIGKEDADRLQDDWLIGCTSLEEAEKKLSTIRGVYQTLGLDINGSKTSIDHLKDIRHPEWIAIIRAIKGKKLFGRALHDFCRTALSLQSQHPKDKVLSYVISILFSLDIRSVDIPIIEAFLLKATIVSPQVTNDVCTLLLNYVYESRPINVDRVCKRFIPFVEKALENGHDFEAAWGLFLLRGLKVPLKSKKIINLGTNYEGAVIPLLLLDMESKGQITSLPKEKWQGLIKNAELKDSLWLLAYEGVRHKWLKDPKKKIRNHPMLKPLFDRDIVFYDDQRNVSKRKAILKSKQKRMKTINQAVAKYLAGYD